jgi:hypothetical protein
MDGGSYSAWLLPGFIDGVSRLAGIDVYGVEGFYIARLMGFSPTTQVYTALETTVANLCWVPPLVGWLKGESN